MFRKSDQPKKGMTSEEAAALILSDGQTKDIAKAAIMDNHRNDMFDMDALTRAALRRQMGFDFEVKVRPNKLHVFSIGRPRVTAYAKVNEGDMDKYGNIINPELIDRLVEACMTLKERYDAAIAKQEA